MTTINQAKDIVLKRFDAHWDSDVCPVVYDNEASEGQNAPWARLTIRNTSGGQDTLGKEGNRKFLRTAHVIIQIFTKLQEGTKQSDELAQEARDIFECRSISGLDFGSGEVREIGPDGGWYIVVVDVIFNYYETK